MCFILSFAVPRVHPKAHSVCWSLPRTLHPSPPQIPLLHGAFSAPQATLDFHLLWTAPHPLPPAQEDLEETQCLESKTILSVGHLGKTLVKPHYAFPLPVSLETPCLGFPGGTNGKEPTCQCRRRKRFRFSPRVRKIPWRKAWQPNPVFLPGDSHGQRNLLGYSPWGHKGSDTTEATKHALMYFSG